MIAQPPVGLSVSPPRIVLAAGRTEEIHVANNGTSPATIAAGTSGLELSLRGRPRIVSRPPGLAVRPRSVTLAPAQTATVLVSSVRKRLAPGDHPGLVLLTGRAVRRGVAVGVRIGVVVLVRAPGRVVHRLVPVALRMRGRVLELLLRNRGNVAEELAQPAVRVRLLRGGRVVGRAAPVRRRLLPRTLGVCTLRYAAHVRGRVVAEVQVRSGAHVVRRRFRLRLPAG